MLACLRGRSDLGRETREALLHDLRLSHHAALFEDESVDDAALLAAIEPNRLSDALTDLGMPSGHVKALKEHLFPSAGAGTTPTAQQSEPTAEEDVDDETAPCIRCAEEEDEEEEPPWFTDEDRAAAEEAKRQEIRMRLREASASGREAAAAAAPKVAMVPVVCQKR